MQSQWQMGYVEVLFLTEPKEGTVHYRMFHGHRSCCFLVCLLIVFVLYSNVMYKKVQVCSFHSPSGSRKSCRRFFFGHMLIFLPNLGQGDLEIALIDCSGNCSQLMNTIK